ncbi:MAG: single-stranded DNA-binding protein [Clostridiales bacterium]|nr:single-stranded DNA-binding protein [Clostridiales bacterium]
MNDVKLLGRLTADPELCQTTNGKYFTSFFLAVPRRTKEPETDFPKLMAWGKTAENICKYLHKGSKIAVSGKVRTKKYSDSEGKSRSTTEIHINNWEFAESRPVAENK